MTSPSSAAAPRNRGTARIRSAVADVVERVFGTVDDIHAAAVRSCVGAAPHQRLTLDEAVGDLLHRPGELAVGVGLVVAPQPDLDLPLRLQWWQADAEDGRLRALEPDLKPTSLGYYDYTAAEWFDVPRRTGRRYVVGPYVDVHGTGRYLLTFTEPIVIGGRFLGVAGADVQVSRFEIHLMRVLGPSSFSFLLLNDEGRVVLSTSSTWLVGELAPTDVDLSNPARKLPGVPWRLQVLEAANLLKG